MTTNNRPQFAVVHWINSAAYSAETTFLFNEEVDTTEMVSVGFVMADNDKFIALAKEYHKESNNCWRTVSTYPKACVTKIIYYKEIK